LSRIHHIDLSFEDLTLKLANPFGISRGTSTVACNILIKLSYDGLVGLGEAAPSKIHGETPESAKAFLETVRQARVLGHDPLSIDGLMDELDQLGKGHYAAKSAINLALWDLIGKINELPLYKYLELTGISVAQNDMTIGIDTLAAMVRKAKEAVAAGFKILKIKLGTPSDREIVSAIRQEIAPDVLLRVDANGAWDADSAIQMAQFLADKNVQLIEQPLPISSPLSDYELIRRNSPLPIFADEPVRQAVDVMRLHSGIDGVVLKLGKSGGLSGALELIKAARAVDLKIMLGCFVESSLGITAACHIASLVDYIDLDGALLLADDPFQGVIWSNGQMQLPERPGIGVIARD